MIENMPFSTGPFLNAAFICEKVLVEQDGVKSAIRIVDRILRQAQGASIPLEMEPFEHDLFIFARFKSGSARGPMGFQLKLIRPSGESPNPMSFLLNFEGEDDRGTDVVLQMKIKFEQAGLHWFYVILEDITVTKIPLRVVYMPQITQMPPSNNNLPPA